MVKRALRALLPFAVTAAILYAISRRVDMAGAFERIDGDTLLLLIPALAIYGALSLCIDALSLMCARAGGSFVPMARLKAASYPLGLLHYALGVGALVVLLRRRAGLGLADATGVVMLISGFDLLALLGVAALAVTWAATDATSLRLGVVAGLLIAGALGLFVLRSTASSAGVPGWIRERLEALRSLRLFRAIRALPTPQLAQLLALRLLFVVTFLALGGAALAAFGIHPPLGTLIVGFAQIALVAAIPIAVAGLGTSQAAFLFVFRAWAPAEELLAASLALSAGIIAVRVALGVACVGEFSRRSVAAALDVET
jgi:hypothetical protein